MKNGQKGVTISRNDSKKVFRAIEEGDPKAVRELLSGHYRIALLTQRLLIRKLKDDSGNFSPQQLGTILGICSDKAIALLKATKDLGRKREALSTPTPTFCGRFVNAKGECKWKGKGS